VKTLVFNNQTDLQINPDRVAPIVKHVLHSEKIETDEVSIYFVDQTEISKLHNDFFGDPSVTDCISFPMDSDAQEKDHILGEVFVCPQTAIDYILTSAEEVTENSYLETTLYLIHGLLHLIGYTDQEDDKRTLMHARQNTLLQELIKHHKVLSA